MRQMFIRKHLMKLMVVTGSEAHSKLMMQAVNIRAHGKLGACVAKAHRTHEIYAMRHTW